MAGRKIITNLIDDGLRLFKEAPAYPVLLNRADPAVEVLRGRASQMMLPKSERLKPTGPQFFETSPQAYETTLTRVPQENFMHMLPQPVYGKDLPKNNRILPLLENFEDVASVYADKMRPFVDKNVGYFYHTGPIYKKAEDLLQSDLGADEFMDRFSKTYAGASPRTGTDQNLLNASILNYRDLEGLDLGYPVLNRLGNNDVGYPMIKGMHPDLTRRLLADEPTFLNNPKPTSFAENVRGNLQGITADTHNIRGILVSYDELYPGQIPREWFKSDKAYRAYRENGLTPDLLKGGIDDSLGSQTVGGIKRQSEYGPIAEITERSAEMLGVPPAMGQSLGWFGLGNMTNLKSAPKTLTEILGDHINITAQYLGESPDDVFKMYMQGKIPLMNEGGRVEKGGGGKIVDEALDLIKKLSVDDVFRFDNPGGSWLKRKQELADEAMRNFEKRTASGKGLVGPSTAFTRKPYEFDAKFLKTIPGAYDEAPFPGSYKFNNLAADVDKYGWNPTPIMINVNYKGEPFITEGNTRTAVANYFGIPSVPAEIRYLGGGEQALGDYTPDVFLQNLREGKVKNQGGAVDDADIDAAMMTAKNETSDVNGRIHAQGGGLKVGTTRELAEYLMKFMSEEEAIKTATMLASRETRAAAADLLIRKKLLEKEKFTGTGKKFESFFDDVTRGKSAKFIPSNLETYQGAITLNPEQELFKKLRQGYSGNFDQHIKTSIPGFDEVQNAVGNAVIKTLPQGGTFLDIGSSEGALLKAIVEGSEGRIRAHGVDPNLGMYETFNAKGIPEGATMERAAFGAPEDYGKLAWGADDTGPETYFFNPQNPYDVAHEAMVYQFISNERKPQLVAMKEALRPGGLMIAEEKFGNVKPLYDFNEAKKDAYKAQFYTPEQIETKRQEVLMGGGDAIEGMNDYQVSQDEMERILSDLYGHRAQFWDSGNFKGYAASDDKALLDDFIGNLGDLSSAYETEFMPRKFASGGMVDDADIDAALMIAQRDHKAPGGSEYGELPPLPYDTPPKLLPDEFTTPEERARAKIYREGNDMDRLLASSYSDDAITNMAAEYNMEKYIEDVLGPPPPEESLDPYYYTLSDRIRASLPERGRQNFDMTRNFIQDYVVGVPDLVDDVVKTFETGETPSMGRRLEHVVNLAPGLVIDAARPALGVLKKGYEISKPVLKKMGLPVAAGFGLAANADEAEGSIIGSTAAREIADPSYLRALGLFRKGADPKEIEALTGWYRTPDIRIPWNNTTILKRQGDWKGYLDPQGLRFKNRVISNQPIPARDVLEWKELDRMYPGLLDRLKVIPTMRDINNKNSLIKGAAYFPEIDTIGLGQMTGDFYKPFGGDPWENSFMHELQHAIQRREFTPGGTSHGAAQEAYARRADQLNLGETGKYLLEDTNNAAPFYITDLGEIEARNAANRFANPQLRSLPISATEDVPLSAPLSAADATAATINDILVYGQSDDYANLMKGQPTLRKDRP